MSTPDEGSVVAYLSKSITDSHDNWREKKKFILMIASIKFNISPLQTGKNISDSLRVL